MGSEPAGEEDPIRSLLFQASVAAMANTLLDFVMSLVRDPQAAAQYAADPAGVLSAAGLPGVTAADVQNLLPVVTDSLAMSTPSFGEVIDASTVWTSGAAAAALDAFHVPPLEPMAHEPLPQVDVGSFSAPPAVSPGDAVLYPHVDEPLASPAAAPDPLSAGLLDHPAPDLAEEWAAAHQSPDLQPDHHPVGHPGFDLI